ncbi:16S rRNA (guanine(966)-N(2))-methyltransferase RsmD [Undibacterium sp. Ren11W]|uniref:16S rRNA (guanine(966)-N(2))-methyltransferase RsmD n=1 Tax=Undibacterium sp. Ren11W TaxID=3413045 RepID=UPI003BF3EA58
MKTNNKKTPVPSRPSHQVRIIAGRWKRTPLNVIVAEGLRPTPDRVRETVFNWLNFLLPGGWQDLVCLDLFAGSGALGFEAASRGATQVTMVESHTPAFKQLEQVKQKLSADEVVLLRADAITVATGMAARRQTVDLIFLDPPFGLGILQKILPICAQLLTQNGLLYVEAEHALMIDGNMQEAPDYLLGWNVLRADQAGAVHYHILQRSNLAHDLPENQA